MRAIEQLTPRALSRNTRESAAHFLGSLCDSKHLPSAYCTTLILILSPDHLQITSQLPSHATAITNAQREKRQLSLRLSTPQRGALRPRRRGRLLRQSLPNEVNKERVDSKLGPWDSCTGYCHEHRLPNNLSDRVKRRLYLVASQTHWDRQPHVAALVRSRDVEARVQQRQSPSPTLQSSTGSLTPYPWTCAGRFPERWPANPAASAASRSSARKNSPSPRFSASASESLRASRASSGKTCPEGPDRDRLARPRVGRPGHGGHCPLALRPAYHERWALRRPAGRPAPPRCMHQVAIRPPRSGSKQNGWGHGEEEKVGMRSVGTRIRGIRGISPPGFDVTTTRRMMGCASNRSSGAACLWLLAAAI